MGSSISPTPLSSPSPAPRFLVDASAWIDALQPVAGKDALRERVRALITADQVVTVGATQAEVLRGTRDEAEFRRLASMFSSLERVPTEERDWDEAARLGFDLRRRGFTVGLVDLLIATIAHRRALTLLHSDADFDQIARYITLTVESHM